MSGIGNNEYDGATHLLGWPGNCGCYKYFAALPLLHRQKTTFITADDLNRKVAVQRTTDLCRNAQSIEKVEVHSTDNICSNGSPPLEHQVLSADNLCRNAQSIEKVEVRSTDNLCSISAPPKKHQVRSTVIFDCHTGRDEYEGATHLLGWPGNCGCYKYFAALPLLHRQKTSFITADDLNRKVAVQRTTGLCKHAPIIEKPEVHSTYNICSNGRPPLEHQVLSTDNLCRNAQSIEKVEVRSTDNLCSISAPPKKHQVRSTVIFDCHTGRDEYEGATHLLWWRGNCGCYKYFAALPLLHRQKTSFITADDLNRKVAVQRTTDLCRNAQSIEKVEVHSTYNICSNGRPPLEHQVLSTDNLCRNAQSIEKVEVRSTDNLCSISAPPKKHQVRSTVIFDCHTGRDEYEGATHLLGWPGNCGCYKYFAALPLLHRQKTSFITADDLNRKVAVQRTTGLCKHAPIIEKPEVHSTDNICSNGRPPLEHQVLSTDNLCRNAQSIEKVEVRSTDNLCSISAPPKKHQVRSTVIFDCHTGRDEYEGATHLLGWRGNCGCYKYFAALPLLHRQKTSFITADDLNRKVAVQRTTGLCKHAPIIEKPEVHSTDNICSNGRPPLEHQVLSTDNLCRNAQSIEKVEVRSTDNLCSISAPPKKYQVRSTVIFDCHTGRDEYDGATHLLWWRGNCGCYKYFAALPLLHRQKTSFITADDLNRKVAVQRTTGLCKHAPIIEKPEVHSTYNICSNGRPPLEHQVLSTDNLCRNAQSIEKVEVRSTDNLCSISAPPKKHQVRSTVIFDCHTGRDEYEGATHLLGWRGIGELQRLRGYAASPPTKNQSPNNENFKSQINISL
jgi:hypothetical protein